MRLYPLIRRRRDGGGGRGNGGQRKREKREGLSWIDMWLLFPNRLYMVYDII